MKVNPAYDPELYASQYERGKQAKLKGEPREPKTCHGFCFHYSYEAGAWFDGYDETETIMNQQVKKENP